MTSPRQITVSIDARDNTSKKMRYSRRRHPPNQNFDEDVSSSDPDTPNMTSPSPRYKFAVPLISPRTYGYRFRRHSILPSVQSPVHSLTPPSSSSFWPGTHELRRVFRSFDRDADGLISVGELRLGLSSMGFDVSHLTNLSRLTAEMNADVNGQIKESSFVRVFRKLNRDKVIEELKADEADNVLPDQLTYCVVVDIEPEVDYSTNETDHLPRLCMNESRVSPHTLATYLLPTTPSASSSHSNRTARKVRWIDCVGVHAATLSLLSNHYSIPPSCFDPALLGVDSTPHLAYAFDPMRDNGVLSVLMHAMALVQPKSNQPTRMFPVHIHKRKPAARELTALPVHIIVVGDHTVITIHPLTSSDEESDIYEEFRTLLKASIAQDLPLASPYASTLHTSSAQSLAVELMDEVTDWNWSMRDDLHQWKYEIESRMSGKCKPAMLDEIHNIQSISLQAQRSVTKMSSMLELVVEEEDRYESQQSHHSIPRDSTQPSSGVLGSHNSHDTSSNRPKVIDLTTRQSRHMFFSDIRRDFSAMTASNTRLNADLKLTHELIVPLVGYYRQRRDEETNQILYLLTVLTAMITPLQLSSSVYGMNFVDIPELGYRFGYPIFWACNITVVIFIAILFKRKGWL